MKIALQIDPPSTLNTASDTSLLLGKEAKNRGLGVDWYHPSTCSIHTKGGVTACVSPLFDEGDAVTSALSDYAVVLLRQNPPFDMAYITNTHMLEQLPASTRVLNNPKAVREHPEKLFPLKFPEFVPPMLISACADDITAFAREQGEVVIKPLFGFGGMGIFKINHALENLQSLLELLLAHKEPLVVQRFLPEVATQEKRIILINGKVEGAFQRKPMEGEIRSNMRVGGTPHPTTLTPKESAIADAVGSYCRAHGLVLVGLDTIGGYLNEINITSPTGLLALKQLYNTTPEKTFWDAVFGG